MEKLISYFFFDYHLKFQTAWFKKLLYFLLIIECIYYFRYFDLLFGENSIVFVASNSFGFFKDLAFLLYNSGSAILGRYFIIATIMLSLLNLFLNKFRFVGDVVLWVLVINIHNRIYPALTGGDNLLNQLLFFNCFLASDFTIKPHWRYQLRICIHNLAIIGVIVQVCIVYFFAALAKLNDQDWLTGKAIIATLQIKHFSLFSFLNYNQVFDPIYIFLNYLVLAYQLLFPVLIWIKKIKKPFLVLGILMHIHIAFVMGLVSFGLIMILAYTFFWPSKRMVS